MFIDLHTHSLLSDGSLLPSELIRRLEAKGLKGVAITDHADESNITTVIEGLLRVYEGIKGITDNFYFIPGVELTHIRPERFYKITHEARRLGAKLIIAHGETLAEPVAPGTNIAAIEAQVDILAHPGLISQEAVLMANEKGVFLEVTSRKGHSLSNGHVVKMAQKLKAGLVFNTDSHSPLDFLTEDEALRTIMGSGLNLSDAKKILKNNISICKRIL